MDNKVKNDEAIARYQLWEGVEFVDVAKLLLTEEEYRGAMKYNILKYRLRDKGTDAQDLIKAKDYRNELDELTKILYSVEWIKEKECFLHIATCGEFKVWDYSFNHRINSYEEKLYKEKIQALMKGVSNDR
jgi:hypothetical protein